MKYLFFDIECSNCFKGIGKMCEFGYVLTDENFNVIKKDDIPMSPGRGEGNRFHLKGRKHEKDLELAYEYDYYYSLPEFPAFYNRIKSIMEDKDTICFAYSMDNDIPHLYHACTRYRKQPFNYTCYDVQKFVATYLEMKGQTALKEACQQIVGPNSTVQLQEHLSRDDAMMEMMVFEAICKLQNISSKELLEKSDMAKTNSMDYMNGIKEHQRKVNNRRAGRDLYLSLCIESDQYLNDEKYNGKHYNISVETKTHLDDLKKAITAIKEKDGIFVNDLSLTDYFVVYDENNLNEIKDKLSDRFKGTYLLVKDLIK